MSGIPRGAIRFNTDSNKPELWDGSQWAEFQLSTPNLGRSVDAQPGARGLFGGGYEYGNPAGTRPTSDVIDYINISSTGNAIDFGNLTESRGPSGAVASSTRGVWMAGDKTPSPYRSNTIDYVTIASTGNAAEFGDTIVSHGHGNGNVSNSTRGLCAGGRQAPTNYNDIEYITIASTGNGIDFGDLTSARYGITGVSSPTRGVFSGGDLGPAFTSTMDFVTIATLGNAQEFGDRDLNTSGIAGASNPIRGIFAGSNTSPFSQIDYIIIASGGDTMNFGDLVTLQYSRFRAGSASPTRAVFAGGYASPNGPGRNDMDYVMIMSEGKAVDFGDLSAARGMAGGCSNAHGGL